jgi:uncharacterized delta-60 repeat protein
MDRSLNLAALLIVCGCGKVTPAGEADETNEPPLAMAAELGTWMSTPIAGQLEGQDPDGDPLEFAVAEDPAHGTVDLDADGSFRYLPARGTSGADSFRFAIDDGNGGSDQATVDIAVATLTDGTPDESFGEGGAVITDLGDGNVHAGVAVAEDGRVFAVGNSASDWAVVAGYSARGGLLTPWGESGSGTTMLNLGGYDGFGDVVQQPGGRLVSVGQTQDSDRDFLLVGLDGDGHLDTSFGSGGITVTDVATAKADVANAVEVLPDGRLLVAGYASNGTDDDFAVARYSKDGVLDDGFGSGGFTIVDLGATDRVNDVAVDAAGNILLVGEAGEDMGVVRLTAEGDPDGGFGAGGALRLDRGEYDEAIGVAVGPDGTIYVGGSTQDSGAWNMAVATLTPGGELDARFGEGGWAVARADSAESYATAMLLLPNQTLLLVGSWIANDVTQAAAARIDMDGRLDGAFGEGGFYHQAIGKNGNDMLFAVALQEDGKVVAAGWSKNDDIEGLLVRLGW